jgi:hypothetical protein
MKTYSFSVFSFLIFSFPNVLSGQIKPYDILINEFMPAPAANRELPNVEYIELYNRLKNKKDSINLNNFKIWNGSVSSVLPSYWLKADSYVVIYTQKAGVFFKPYCTDTIALPTTNKLVTLSNPSDTFYLTAPDGKVIDVASFDLSFYQNAGKAEAGLALERTQPNAPCSPLTWMPSIDKKGGTPAKVNSIVDLTMDKTPPILERYYVKNSTTIVLIFDKSLNRDTAFKIQNYDLNSIKIKPIDTIKPAFNSVELNLETALKKDSIYTLIVKSNLKDCQGIPLSKNYVLDIRLPEKPKAKDLIINEILANPELGDGRFIELYNNSKKTLDIVGLQIKDVTKNDVKIITSNFLLLPNKYVVLAEKPYAIRSRYHVSDSTKFNILKNKLPTWNEASGNVSILTDSAKIIDSFSYQKSWHNPLLATTDGVSLERLSPTDSSTKPTNWQSAAEKSGFATPAQRNSQYRNAPNTPSVSATFWLEKNSFSPDGDGFEDALLIHYKLEKSGGVANIKIFDSAGRFIKSLATNELLAGEGVWQWHGERENTPNATVGIYILDISVLFKDGTSTRQKLPCALTTRF